METYNHARNWSLSHSCLPCFCNCLAMATHSSTLAWKMPWMEEAGRLQSMVSLRVGHDWVTSLSLFTFMHREGNGNPFQCSCLENPGDGKSWWAAVYGVAQSWARLKRRSSSSILLTSILSPRSRLYGFSIEGSIASPWGERREKCKGGFFVYSLFFKILFEI